MFDDGQEIDIPCNFLAPVPPSKQDKVREIETGDRELYRKIE